MKKIVFALAATVILVACNRENSNKNEGGLHLTGTVEGLTQGKLYIYKVADTSVITLDSIIIKGDSHFESNLPLEEPEMLFLSLDRGVSRSMDNMLPFFAEQGNMNITTTLNEFYAKAKITGSKNHELYDLYNKTKVVVNDERNKTLSLTLLAKKIKSDQKLDSLALVNDKLTIKRYLNAVNFAVTHGKHEVAPYIILSEIPDVNIKYLDTIQKSMSPEVAKSKYGKILTDYIVERKKLGE